MGSVSSSMSTSFKLGGNAYTKKLYFDPEADSSKGRGYSFTDEELREKLTELVDITQDIQEVRYYKHPIVIWQCPASDVALHHAFIVFETNAWWWSIEKNSRYVSIQRSKFYSYVREKYGRRIRSKEITLAKEKRSGTKTVKELIHHLWVNNYLNEEYDVLTANCQHFAESIYGFIAFNQPMVTITFNVL